MSYLVSILLTTIFYVERIREFRIKRDTVRGPIKEKRSFMFLFLTGSLVFVAAVIECITRGGNIEYYYILIGSLIIISSFILRRTSIRMLGEFWSVHVEIRNNHELIDSGPYSRVRHPVYTAAVVEVIGAVILLKAPITSIAILILVIPSILYRIKLEEAELVEKFGDKYLDYMKRTGALFPALTRSTKK